MLAERGADCRGHLRLDPRGGVAADVADLEREALALADDRRRVVEQALEPLDVERRRHGERAAGRRASAFAASSASASARSLSRLRSWTSSNRTAETPASSGSASIRDEEHAVGHGDHAGRLADLAVEPRRVADRLARLFAELAGHELRRGAGGEAARDEQQHLSAAPFFAEQRRRDPGRLARARAAQPAARACPGAAPRAGRQVPHRSGSGINARRCVARRTIAEVSVEPFDRAAPEDRAHAPAARMPWPSSG